MCSSDLPQLQVRSRELCGLRAGCPLSMVNLSSSLTNNVFQKGALGLALSLPLLTTLPARAQTETITETETDSLTVDVLEQPTAEGDAAEKVEATEVESVEVDVDVSIFNGSSGSSEVNGFVLDSRIGRSSHESNISKN